MAKTLPDMAAVTPYTPENEKQRGTIRTTSVQSDCIGMILNFRGDFENQNLCYITSGGGAGTQINERIYMSILTGFSLYKSVKYDWTRDHDIFYAPYRNLTKKEIADCVLFALLHGSNQTATTTVETDEALFYLQNWFNPFDTEKFDWTHLSKIGKQAFEELTQYCEHIVKWKTLQTPYGNNKGNGIWLGLYQYRTSYDTVNKTYKKKFGKDYPNRDLYGIPYPESFKSAIEELRKRVEALAIDLCLTAGKEVTRTRDTFWESATTTATFV